MQNLEERGAASALGSMARAIYEDWVGARGKKVAGGLEVEKRAQEIQGLVRRKTACRLRFSVGASSQFRVPERL